MPNCIRAIAQCQSRLYLQTVVFEERGMIRIYIYCMMHEYSIQPYRIFTDMAYLGFYHHTCKCLTDI